ncbi:unnamed protein product [Arabidopsis arenosa]|uniref:Pentatricopeptide repeat-containing protein n=1 Tax=Arabidopsis arenosa TaxID=38785 RepID=A0A8S1ZVB4_ARAAE|nr:unnamed protein product [Arabidopsis arenosa]
MKLPVTSSTRAVYLLRRVPFSSTSTLLHTPPEAESYPSHLPHHLLSILSKPNWQNNPSLNSFLPAITPSHVSSLFSLNLDPHTALQFSYWISQTPNFKHNVDSYASLLTLIDHSKIVCDVPKIIVSMIKCCYSAPDALFVSDICRKMSKDDITKLTLKCYNELLTLLARFGLVDEMNQLYTEMLENFVSMDMYTFNLMINVYCKMGFVKEAKQFMCKMIQAGFCPDYFTSTSFILGYCRSKDVDSAFRVFQEMPNRNEVSYNQLIHGLCEAGRIDEAVSLFVRMKDDFCYPNVYTYTALIKGLCRKNVHKAMGLLDEMLERNLVPDLITYNSLIAGQCRAGHLDSAYRLLSLMKERGLVPDQGTYGCFIDFLCKSKRVEEARRLFESLTKEGVSANVIMYSALIDGYCKAGKVDDAGCLFEKMLSKNCSPNAYTFNALIHGLCRVGNLKEALSLFDQMVKMGLKPTVYTYNILIGRMLKQGDFDDAHKCLQKMMSSGEKPVARTYNTFIEAYCSAGKVQVAEDMMVQMKEEGVPPDDFTYTSLIKAYGKLGLTYSAFDVLKRMFDADCEPSHHTFLSLIKQLFEKKYVVDKSGETGIELVSNIGDVSGSNMWKVMEYDIVIELFEEMAKHGCTPDAKCYEKLISGICKVENLGIALKLLDQMQKEGISPSEMIFNAVISCCCKLQKYGEAANIVEDMICSDHSPQLEHCKTLICGLYEKGERERGYSVFKKLLGCGYNDDEIAWKILIDGMLKQGLVEECSQLFQEMEKNGCNISPRTHSILTQKLHGKD